MLQTVNASGIVVELDPTTADVLEHLAQCWGVSKEEVVRRALAEAGRTTSISPAVSRIEAFRELQRRLRLTPAKAAAWQTAVREARR